MKRCPYRNALKVCCFCIQTFSNIKVSVSSIILGNTKLRLTVLVLWRNVRICDRSPCCTCSHSRIMCESYACGLNALISSIKDNFSHLTHKSTQIVLNRMINSEKIVVVVRTSLDIFGSVQKSSENHQKASEVAGMFSEILVMRRRGSRAFVSEKVGRYIMAVDWMTWLVVWYVTS